MEPIDRRMLLGAAGLAGVAAMSKLASGGPLMPPPGPVSPTGKTLSEVEPRIPVQSLPGSATALHVISEPGSYYLTGNIQGMAGKRAIEISASGVVLHLGDAVLVGAPGVEAGVESLPGVAGIQIQGGNFIAWPNSVLLGDASSVERLSSVDLPTGVGVRVGGHGLIDRCVATGPGNGIRLWAGGEASLISNSVARGGDNCFRLQFGSHLDGCVAAYGALGLDCPNAGQHVRGLRALRCNVGVNVDSEAVIEGCEFFNCFDAGINCFGARVTIRRNVALATPTGVRVSGGGNAVSGNEVSGATTAYDIAPGNSHGPIVNVAGVGDISSVAGANHPWANFIY